MSHRRVKDIAYDDEDIYDEDDYDEGEEELTEEDKEQMRQGTIKVREALGAEYSNISNKQIEEALWNYYYDIGKSVTYLKNAHKPAQPKKAKQPSRFDQAAAAGAAAAKPQPKKTADPSVAFPLPMFLPTMRTGRASTDFFADTPWLNVPAHRLGKLAEVHTAPRGYLLGGSSKPSKLAALAAARKKKQEEAKASAPVSSADAGEPAQDKAIALLDRLKTKTETPPKDPSPGPSVLSEKTNVEEEEAKAQAKPRAYPIRRKKSPSLVREEPVVEPEPLPEPEEQPATKRVKLEDVLGTPSTFATSMFGPRPGGQLDHSMFPLPYTSYPEYAKAKPFAGPSPDDVVLNAQAKGAKKKQSQAKDAKAKDEASGISEGVEGIKIDDAPRVKSKNLNVLEEYEKSNMKKSANFVVIGHVDHGKSTLMGRLLYDLKVVDQRSVDKLRKEAQNIGKSSFALAWVMDETSEERSRGVTVDIATNTFETEKTKFTILDAPGHKDFVPNMIAGASQADFAVLVIDASTNSFESGLRGQTKEHALLARSIGVQRLIVAVNKMDTISWSKDRFDEISQQMSAFLTTAGFQSKNIAFVPCAGLTGDNIVQPPPTEAASWYTGPTLVAELEASEPSKRAIDKPLRLTIGDVFRGGITNPLSVSGRIDAGALQVGDHLVVMPSGESAYIKGIEVDNTGEPADWAVAGQIVTLHLAEIDPQHLRIGDIVCHASAPIKNIKIFTAKILAFEHVTPMYVDVLKGRLNVPARISQLVAVLDKASGEPTKKKPRIVQPGAVARVVVELTQAVPLEPPSRVVLRSEGSTVAAGLLEEAS
ncbi:Elongation factor TU GTP binding domain-containing protein [Lasiodiplodia theobromae]|uniref:Elongation factor TU GTP binding domain-containing protein n=1 Tax=Lasiodiplodia theobromae TaxID=45133 RepID=UPI0015C2D2B3|nr:Elongation factor TU GTP binding domain-containing protein [Lasiodiplodia theobromae]KAF4541878.1 Elongation factor TU GTP binding domain-containing protein [Lasiodiplodia theobromae]